MPSLSSPDDVDIAPDSDGWDDVEDDAEDVALRCLFCDFHSSDLSSFLSHGKAEHSFDLIAVKADHALDFYGAIKLVNYVRSEVNADRSPDLKDPLRWADEVYLQPVLDNDAVLFSLGELDVIMSDGAPVATNTPNTQDEVVMKLEQHLARLQVQFDRYREQVSQTLDKRWQADSEAAAAPPPSNTAPARDTYDDQYFQGYSSNDIHQIMLQDTVRTDAYRDFIYDNKHLFKDKIVMDVGCGTGILSMFCARAGARKVVAVDNSGIIDKARQIAADNNLLDRITFVKRKVEEIDVLPDGLSHVDVIISEWMGYCLLFEAMLPSVLVARDRFLKRAADGKVFDGLIVPSHCSLQIAPLFDPEWMTDNVAYWHDVYGFDMHYMLQKSFDDVVIRFPSPDTIFAESTSNTDLRVWDLYQTEVDDLQFASDFTLKVSKDVDSLDGWCIWFDIGFSLSRPPHSNVGTIKDLTKTSPGAVTFTTGPHGTQTHWQTGVCVIERSAAPIPLKNGNVISGTLVYAKGDETRALEIEVKWRSDIGESGSQLWKLR